VTRVPGAPREGDALSSRARARLSSSAPARDLLRPRKWTATAKVGACRLRLASVRGSMARQGVSARRIRLQKSANDVEVQRSAIPRGKGARGRGPKLPGARKSANSSGVASRKGVDNRYRGGKAMAPGRSEPGVRKGIAGRRPSQDGRHPGSSLGSLVHAGDLQGDLGGSRGAPARVSVLCPAGEATGVSEARRAHIATGRKRPSR